ncbi:MAG: hypothetical protein NZ696_01440 [Thermomicrobium sp.]|nr:hypothetical protein [Thermomicrobium sp.]MDW7982289.1 hypothetical protein [Thermomicrobium sp.]
MRRTWYRVGDEPVPEGAVLRRDVVVEGDGRRQFRRGTPLREVLASPGLTPGIRVPIAAPVPGELEQHAASRRIAVAIAGPGTVLDEPHQGQVNVRAATFGVVRVEERRLQRLVGTGRALVATVLDGRVAEAGEVIAIAKAPALFVPGQALERALALLGGEAVVRVAPFRARRVALLAGERVRPAALTIATQVLGEKLQRLGASLEVSERLERDDVSTIAERTAQWRGAGIELILTAGSILLDPDDPFLRALQRLRARLALRGAPVDPGTMFWVAYLDDVPIVGLASCEMYGRISVFDLALPYALAREPLDRVLFARLAHGGLLEDTQSARLPRAWRTDRESAG